MCQSTYHCGNRTTGDDTSTASLKNQICIIAVGNNFFSKEMAATIKKITISRWAEFRYDCLVPCILLVAIMLSTYPYVRGLLRWSKNLETIVQIKWAEHLIPPKEKEQNVSFLPMFMAHWHPQPPTSSPPAAIIIGWYQLALRDHYSV